MKPHALLAVALSLLLPFISQAQSSINFLSAPIRVLPPQTINSPGICQVPFNLKKGMIQLTAQVDAEQQTFILDTGAPGLVLHTESDQKQVGKTASSCSAVIELGEVDVASFTWAQQYYQDFTALGLDMSHLGQGVTKAFGGLIGYDLLQEKVVMIDYQREKLVLLTSKTSSIDFGTLEHLRVPFTLMEHLPVVELQIEGCQFRFGVDTGAANNLLDQASFAQLAQKSRNVSEYILQGLDQEKHRVSAKRIGQIQLAGKTTSSDFLIHDLSHLQFENHASLDGLVGFDLLKDYTVVIDYPRQELILLLQE